MNLIEQLIVIGIVGASLATVAVNVAQVGQQAITEAENVAHQLQAQQAATEAAIEEVQDAD